MAVAIRTTDFPEAVGTDMYDGVQAAMDIDNNPPEGLVFHWAGDVDGKWTITDVFPVPCPPTSMAFMRSCERFSSSRAVRCAVTSRALA